jgi:uncharacterized protein YodC (DUF2158 family)
MSDSSTIGEGDIVRLKSGGPAMTVQVRSADLLYCVWFSGRELKSGTFDDNMVVKVEGAPHDELLKQWLSRAGLQAGPRMTG